MTTFFPNKEKPKIRQQEEIGKINGFVEEMAAGQKVEKVFNHEKADFKKFCEMNENLRRESTNALTFAGMMVPTIVSLSFVNYAVSACVGGLFALSGLLDIGSLSSYLVYVRQSAMPLNQFTQQINFILAALSGAERIFDLMDEKPEEDGGTVTLCRVTRGADGALAECSEYTGMFAWKRPAADGGNELVPLRGDVRFHDVRFGYTPQKPVLDGISLYAKPGQKLAFVGSTGAGKTTIINLITRFYEIDAGSITYDGIDIRNIRKSDLRHSMAVVLQDTHLFTGTILENIRYGRLNATDEECVEAARTANAYDFIHALPDGFKTVLTADGNGLSQGQRQLLNIARAMLAERPVLILDEATSALDNESERLVQQSLEKLAHGRTVFTIAHRLTTIRGADKILVLTEDGIAEQGSHEELIAKGGIYKELYSMYSDMR